MGGVDRSLPELAQRLPEQFGKYSILGHLATGGMAEVYLARAAGIEGFEKIVVIKRIRPDLIGDHQTTSFFLDEARLVATLEHPNIALVYEIGLVNGSYFFVMEYVHGADLRQLMDTAHRRGREITLADAIYIIIGTCTALHYAHEKRDLDGQPLAIIHRDVSPSNVLISHDGAIKVCDFGIARATTRTTDTNRGVLKGKFAYMSPEQCRSEPLDRRSDIFALGILLYELSTLSRLFDGASDYELLRNVVEAPIPPPSSRAPGYPKQLEQIVMRALQRDPALRYPTAQAMQLDLEAFAREHKLALSSVNVARLMGTLFEKRIDEWLRAQREGRALGDHLVDTAVRNSGHFPVFVPIGSAHDVEISYEAETKSATPRGSTPGVDIPLPRRRSSASLESTEPIERVSRRPSALWIVMALLAGLAAGGVTVAGTVLETAHGNVTTRELDAHAERIANTFDQASRAAHMRADGIAITPMLRAAIETDAATMSDLAKSELFFQPSRGEVLEVFQFRDGKPISLLRIPSTAAGIQPMQGHESRVETDGKDAVIVASSPLAGYKTAVGGVVMIASPVDLAAVRKSVGEHAVIASIAGLEKPIVLVDRAGNRGVSKTIPIISSGEWHKGSLTLDATLPVTAASLDWVVPARWGAVGLAGLFLLIYLVGLLRGRTRE